VRREAGRSALFGKSEGADFPCRISAPSSVFFEDLVRLPNHNYFVASGSFETCEPCGPRFPFSPVAPFVVRAFPVSSKAPGCPFASRDPLPVLLMVRCLLSSLEDLSSVDLKILLISAITRGFSKFCRVEMAYFLWKFVTASVALCRGNKLWSFLLAKCAQADVQLSDGTLFPLAEMKIAPALGDVHVDDALRRPDPVVFFWIAGFPLDAAEVDAPCCAGLR
jgi:hypothetical protein